ncbi:hypothetical protein H310_12327 [Aphanomyces invadans]|uniref:CN hydrolase domain-containing protein n=1 Tax=Aphanomyces invadans TaxID=157072 RepID=A0A024TJH4_9STRA|nr:hypothetical protein H310_12327 [Aphanomyces invadans]ETV93761.1 hypothetical protein H310_12327 [Aphanomyces invadans]|eukprot:XP_008877570.1 hypothetical protein H310_12327 [Aphanomyces invadans]
MAAQHAPATVKVAIVQYEPQIHQVKANMETVTRMLSHLSEADGLHILMLSEMAFTGYCFRDREEIEPLAEEPSKGPTFEWCQRHAKRLKCLVACGYVERGDDCNLYNSMMVLSPAGDLVFNYRKVFLYETDKSWATAGSGFGDWFCPWLGQNLSFGICMDINPCDFEAPYEAYEFASSILAAQSSLVLFSSAWNDHNPLETDPSSLPTIQYWANRLVPVIDEMSKVGTDRNCYFICSNRTGVERGTSFVGGSCILSLKEPSIVVAANRFEHKVLVASLRMTSC